jgi:hypothetical protein
MHAVKPGGHVIGATFAEDGPEKCSGLSVMHYSADGLHAEFGTPFTLLKQQREEPHTPFGTVQKVPQGAGLSAAPVFTESRCFSIR